MSDCTYGFVDEQGILLGFAVCELDDFETLDRIKDEFNSVEYHVLDLTKVPAVIGSTYWLDTQFVVPSPYPSWSWNSEHNAWQAPFPEPEEPVDAKWRWVEDIGDYELVSPIPYDNPTPTEPAGAEWQWNDETQSWDML